MVKLSDEMRQTYENALLSGMTFEGACLLAHIPVSLIEEMEGDEEEMLNAKSLSSNLEQTLLSRMHTISRRQARSGNERATVWLLERLYSRYSQRIEHEGGSIHLHIDTEKLEDMDTVDIVDETDERVLKELE